MHTLTDTHAHTYTKQCTNTYMHRCTHTRTLSTPLPSQHTLTYQHVYTHIYVEDIGVYTAFVPVFFFLLSVLVLFENGSNSYSMTYKRNWGVLAVWIQIVWVYCTCILGSDMSS